MFFTHLSYALLPKQVSYITCSRLLREVNKGIIHNYSIRAWWIRLAITILFPSSASGIIVLLKTGFYFIINGYFFYGLFQGKHSRILLCSGAKKLREMWIIRIFTEAVAYVNLKCSCKLIPLFSVQQTRAKLKPSLWSCFEATSWFCWTRAETILVPGLNETSP